ncbi:hypothetical protein [Nguyenibacter sp. L1]|uniref:hypothetical protein n=1 Tax=Nguyenibacter sp. L1 TaxID=3049350 RepID=UPI002B45FC30|nr:hypothetical protein [Nguyenibacter sp. L1]WRH88488.1 hypothetical protein QN315_02300 [Nguyenibacter sp. L1]
MSALRRAVNEPDLSYRTFGNLDQIPAEAIEAALPHDGLAPLAPSFASAGSEAATGAEMPPPGAFAPSGAPAEGAVPLDMPSRPAAPMATAFPPDPAHRRRVDDATARSVAAGDAGENRRMRLSEMFAVLRGEAVPDRSERTLRGMFR